MSRSNRNRDAEAVHPRWLEGHAEAYALGRFNEPALDELFGRTVDRRPRTDLQEDDPELYDALEEVLGYEPSPHETAQWLEAYQRHCRDRSK